MTLSPSTTTRQLYKQVGQLLLTDRATFMSLSPYIGTNLRMVATPGEMQMKLVIETSCFNAENLSSCI